jgi:hypothetical protein
MLGTVVSNGFAQRLDVSRFPGRIAQHHTQSSHATVDPVLEIHGGIVGPEPSLDIFARHQVAWPLQEHNQDSQGLTLQPDFDSVLAKLVCVKVQFKGSEPCDPDDFFQC